MKRTTIAIIFGVLLGLLAVLRIGEAATNISSSTTRHWAWNDAIGWINFYSTNNITVSDDQLTGYASSSIGDISLDCATTRNGNICAQSDYRVENDSVGNLSGWGWNDTYGWISFYCNDVGGQDPCAYPYRVHIDGSGDFYDFAWNDIVGWISFNGADLGLPTSTYKVSTSWQTTSATGTLDSATFDTQATSGVKLNSVLWHGSQPAGTTVGFQFAMSNSSSGPWSYVGPDGTDTSFYTVNENVTGELGRAMHNGMRFFRYRVMLSSDQARASSPRVDSIIVNWSP